jgi:6-phosphogluconolactonase/glucosamine-6-phosphate isomerase/deaminase
MKTNISNTPETDAGIYIAEKLRAHKEDDVLFLVSGGSALRVLEKIDTATLSKTKSLTIITTDERFTFDQKGNNFMQLQTTKFYKSVEGSDVYFIHSVPQPSETLTSFTNRIRKDLEDYFEAHPETYTIALLGIGEDGHTASIFPRTEQKFSEDYLNDELYVNVTEESVQYPYRTTITPSFIEEKVDDVILFAVGSIKCDNILNYMHNKNFSRHQIPALIPAQHPQSVLFTDCQTLV